VASSSTLSSSSSLSSTGTNNVTAAAAGHSHASITTLPVPLSSLYTMAEIDEAISLTEWESRINLQRTRPNEFGDAAIKHGPLSVHFTQDALDAAIVRRGKPSRAPLI
jgi:hypothetical protein